LLGVKELGVPRCVPEKEPPKDAWTVGACEFRQLFLRALDLYSLGARLEVREVAVPLDAPFFLLLDVRSLDPGREASKAVLLVRLSFFRIGKDYTTSVPGISVTPLWSCDRFELAEKADLREAVREAASALLKEWVDDLVVARAVERKSGRFQNRQ
jgi:hypothetical protein